MSKEPKMVKLYNMTGKHNNAMTARRRLGVKVRSLRLPRAPLFRLAPRSSKIVPFAFYERNKEDIDAYVKTNSMYVEFITEVDKKVDAPKEKEPKKEEPKKEEPKKEEPKKEEPKKEEPKKEESVPEVKEEPKEEKEEPKEEKEEESKKKKKGRRGRPKKSKE